MKLISYMVTCGGDAGFRCSNKPEWCSVGSMLLFDAKKWNIDSIAEAIRQIYRTYKSAKMARWTFAEHSDDTSEAVGSFINTHDGVYVDLDYRDEDGICWLGTLGAKKEKRIHSKEHEVTRWSRNGSESNYDYDK